MTPAEAHAPRTTGRGRGRPPANPGAPANSEETYRKLARELLREGTVPGRVTVRQLAARVGLTMGALYRIFGQEGVQEGFCRLALDDYAARVARSWDEKYPDRAVDPKDHLRRMADFAADFAQERKTVETWRGLHGVPGAAQAAKVLEDLDAEILRQAQADFMDMDDPSFEAGEAEILAKLAAPLLGGSAPRPGAGDEFEKFFRIILRTGTPARQDPREIPLTGGRTGWALGDDTAEARRAVGHPEPDGSGE